MTNLFNISLLRICLGDRCLENAPVTTNCIPVDTTDSNIPTSDGAGSIVMANKDPDTTVDISQLMTRGNAT